MRECAEDERAEDCVLGSGLDPPGFDERLEWEAGYVHPWAPHLKERERVERESELGANSIEGGVSAVSPSLRLISVRTKGAKWCIVSIFRLVCVCCVCLLLFIAINSNETFCPNSFLRSRAATHSLAMGKGGGRKGFMKAAQARREGEDEDGASDTDTGEKKAPVEDAPQVAKHGGKEQAAPGSGSGGDRAEEQEGVAKEETKGQMNQRHKRYVVAVELAAVSFDDASG